MSLELMTPSESRFKALAEFQYEMKELLLVKFELHNKIREEVRVLMDVLRDNTNEDNILPKYKVQGLLEGKQRRYNFMFDLEPNGKSIYSNLLLERQNSATNFANDKLFEGHLNMKQNEENSLESDYDVELKTKSKLGELNVNGKMIFSLFKSTVDLVGKYKGVTFSTNNPVRVKFGHTYDGSENAQSFVVAHLEAKDFGIDHGGKLVFAVDVARFIVEHLELQINRPNIKTPLSIFYKNDISGNGFVKTLGFKNLGLDLKNSDSFFGRALVRVDGQEEVNSIVFTYSKETNNNNASYIMGINKNDNNFVKLDLSYYGSLAPLRTASTELPKEKIGFELFVRYLENSGRIKTDLELESSMKKREHNFQFDFKTEKIFRVILGVISVNAKFKTDKSNAIDMNGEVTTIGDLKSFKIWSKGNTRADREWREFDVNYEKKLSNGKTLSGKGIAKYKLTDFKNFQVIQKNLKF